jgi:hypothetical protein
MGNKARQVITKEKSSCYAFVNVKLNGVLKLAGTFKIQRFDTFSNCKLRRGGYRVSYGSPLKCPAGRVYTRGLHMLC